jgi:hypothetical protein
MDRMIQIKKNRPRMNNGHLTADKREIKDFTKLPSATSFICKPLAESRIFSKQAGGYKYEY